MTKNRRKKLISTICFLVFFAAVFGFGLSRDIENKRFKADKQAVFADGEKELGKNIDDILDNLDTSGLEELDGSLDEEQRKVFGAQGFLDKIKRIISGEDKADYGSVFGYLAATFFGEVRNILPFMLSILGICTAFAVINSFKSGFASESVAKIIKFACVSIVAVILFGKIFLIVRDVSDVIGSINKQINVVFPVILTMMAATGSGGAVAAYTPAVAILGTVLTWVITTIALPCFILSVVFDVVGNLSDTVKLKKMSGFFFSALKWLLGTSFFVFLAFLSVRGITASVHDSISIRTAKFAISNYIPIIGGYLSEGFNLVMASSVLIKNAVGLAAIIMLLLTVAPLVIEIMVFSLALSLLGAIVEPLGLDSVSSIMSGIGKSLKSLVSIILGMSFLYFVFLLLTICTGNLVL